MVDDETSLFNFRKQMIMQQDDIRQWNNTQA
jgi:hypothetical protein